MRWSLDSTNRAQASKEILPSNSHVDAMFSGWPSRSRYRKNASPQERERIRSAVDIVVSFCLGSDPCPPLGNRGGVDWSGSTGQCALRRTSYLTRTPRTNEITIPRIRPGGCESGHRTVFFLWWPRQV